MEVYFQQLPEGTICSKLSTTTKLCESAGRVSRPTPVELCMLPQSTMSMLESDLNEAIRLGNVQRAQIEHLQSLQARQTTPITHGEPAERSVPPALGAGGEATAEGQLAILQEHFNALLQVLPRRCLNNRDCMVEQETARAIEAIFLNSDRISPCPEGEGRIGATCVGTPGGSADQRTARGSSTTADRSGSAAEQRTAAGTVTCLLT